jgi:hypothetical protein
MSSAPAGKPDAGQYDVYLSYSRADLAWAERLAQSLSNWGLRAFYDREDAQDDALESSSNLVVLWSPAAGRSKEMRREIAAFEVLMRADEHRQLVPLVLGGTELLLKAPPAVADRRAIVVGAKAYKAGAAAGAPALEEAVEEIARALDLVGPSTSSFSLQALRALTYAAEMLEDKAADEPRLRAASLLGALLASARARMTPTTGDVVKLVERQSGGPAERALEAAASAADLRFPRTRGSERDIAALSRSAVGRLVEEALEAQGRTGAGGVSLRHVLATGVHPAVPAAVLDQLGVTMAEVRDRWRESIEATWPEEAPGWAEILREPSKSGSTAPPSALVHADRWTTNDQLDYTLYARAIAEFISHKDAKSPMVVSVQAPWGQGKTSLMRMVQKKLDPGHPDLAEEDAEVDEPPTELTYGELRSSLADPEKPDTKPDGIRTVWFNAWKYQSSDQIWAGLAHAILSQLPARLSRKDRELFWLRLQLRRIDPSAVRSDIHRAVVERFVPLFIGALAALIVVGLTLLVSGLEVDGADAAGASALSAAAAAGLAWAKATRDVLRRPLEGAYVRYVRQPDYESKLGYLHLVEEDMARALELLTPDDQPAVIFIDDLDRCSPQNIGEVIEAVNLFLAGDYPNCAFVIGIDAEVVAAAMEVVHSEIIGKLADRRGELGWRFMDKFVQLPFVMPRLHPDQRKTYLRGLFATPSDAETNGVDANRVTRLESALQSGALRVDEVDQAAQEVGEIAPKLAAVDPDRARALGEQVVIAGAKAFSDSDDEVIDALAAQLLYLSDNPRTIKRAVNVYRFHRFAAYARRVARLQLKVATPEQIGRWSVVIVRWPHFVRWLQAQRDEDENDTEVVVSSIVTAAREASSTDAFKAALNGKGIDASWTDDAELWEFLRSNDVPELELSLAGERGLW